MGGEEEKQSPELPLFETKARKGNSAYKLFSLTVFLAICSIWFYRITNIPTTGRWAWIGMFISEVLFGIYWIFTQSARWDVAYTFTFKERLSLRYEEELPGVDVFVCTADPILEPPTLVINTVLSVLSYNYPPRNLSVYLSDDGGSEFTFYALLEASTFSKYWIPFCKKFKVEPRSPEVYFSKNIDGHDQMFAEEWSNTKKLYEEMRNRIEVAMESGRISDEIRNQHKGFSEWNSKTTKQDHQSIVKILIDGRNSKAVDAYGNQLPTLVYLSREKKPGKPHNFKAGSMNALIRVSAEVSNAPIILNLDCDMYSNNADAIREALCFFMDEKRGHEISFVQHPQRYANITKNDLYGNVARATHEIELACLGSHGAALFCGTGCFHRRASLCGKEYFKGHKYELNGGQEKMNDGSIEEVEEASKVVANCSYEEGTQWGKGMGLVYGCPVEDIITGLTIQCRGWKSVYYNPKRYAFLGVVPTTLEVALVQHKRWSEGMVQIFLSKYNPFTYGYRKIKLAAQMGYCIYLLWAPISIPTLCYVILPSLSLLHHISLFPKVTNIWFLPFAYVYAARNGYGLAEALSSGETVKSWWNLQRMWMIRRTTAYFFAFFDTVSRQLGFSETALFTVTGKVMDSDVEKRYQQEIMEFGSSSSLMFTIASTLALLNLLSFIWGAMKLGFAPEFLPQVSLSGVIVMVNMPVYEALFIRKDSGSLPSSVLIRSVLALSVVCLMPVFFPGNA
nr:cellulose synthase-like protein E6 [Ipomoea batatas]